ncbi:hypothetical protein ABLE93_01880 [Xanthobacter sp. KR7-65]
MSPTHPDHSKARTMLDMVMLALGFGLFAGAIGYGFVCERL